MPIWFSFGSCSFPKSGLGFHELCHIHEGPSVCFATCKSCHLQNTGKSCIFSCTYMLLGKLRSYGYPPSYQAGPCRNGNKIPWSSEMITIKIMKKLNKHECLKNRYHRYVSIRQCGINFLPRILCLIRQPESYYTCQNWVQRNIHAAYNHHIRPLGCLQITCIQ